MKWLTLPLLVSSICCVTSLVDYRVTATQSDVDGLYFNDATTAAELNARHQRVNQFDVMTAGAAAGDFNRDGWMDLFVLGGGGTPDTLYINQGDGTFDQQANRWGVAHSHRGAGVAVGDFNSDGWPDLFVTSHGPAESSTDSSSGSTDSVDQHRLYRNNGNGTFSDIAESAGVMQTTSESADAYGAVFGDYDLDGDLDLFVTDWTEEGTGNRLYRNNGDETFSDATAAAGLETTALRGFSPCFVDMDGDRYPELLVAADFDTTAYYVNNGDGTFANSTAAAGVNLPANGMGTTVNDFDNDGSLDWYISAILGNDSGQEGNRLYMNRSNHRFEERAAASGVNDGYWGWGTASVDLNHDGWLDLVETNGWTLWPPGFANMPNRLWLSNGLANRDEDPSITFREVASEVNVSHPVDGRGLLHLDYDNDGDQDLVITTNNGRLYLYENQLPPQQTNWLKIRLDTSAQPELAPDGIGAKVEISIDGQKQMRVANGCPTYLSQNEPTIHFGLGAADAVDMLIVTWPDGTQTIRDDVAANQQLSLAPAIATVIYVPWFARGATTSK